MFKRTIIDAGDQFFARVSGDTAQQPNPCMVDLEPGDGAGPLSVFESGAILQYLAEKTGEFLPKDLPGRTRTMAGGSPLVRYSGRIIISAAMLLKIAYAIER